MSHTACVGIDKMPKRQLSVIVPVNQCDSVRCVPQPILESPPGRYFQKEMKGNSTETLIKTVDGQCSGFLLNVSGIMLVCRGIFIVMSDLGDAEV